MIKSYFKILYKRTMSESYSLAFKEIAESLRHGGDCLDCGANTGNSFYKINEIINFDISRYYGIEWNPTLLDIIMSTNLNILHGDLNKKMPFDNNQFRCVFALSVLEHLLNGCFFMKECHRVLEKGGRFVLLTPNISTFFTIALLLVGKMPSSGPHPDSSVLVRQEEVIRVSDENKIDDLQSETPSYRHLVVFSYRVLRRYLSMLGFSQIQGHGFGLYPFPSFMQSMLERIDPYHCHQMVFVATK